jgi:hypothetical protein
LRLAVVVDLHRCAHDPLVDARGIRGLQQGQGVLGEAAPAIARSGVQELGADPVVEADAARDGAARMSSVFGLKARPQSAMVAPFNFGPKCRRSLVTSTSFCRLLVASTACRISAR